MKRRQFLSMALSLPALLAALTAGCGSGGGTAPISGVFSTSGGSGSDGTNGGGGASDVLRGAAEGYAFLNASGGVVLFPTLTAGAQAGFAPASGLRAEIIDGPSATVGANGLVRLDNSSAGLRKLRISGGSASSPLEVPLTVVPDAVLPLGTPTVSRTEAVKAAMQAAVAQGGGEALIGADVMATSTPLPTGVKINRAIDSDEVLATVAQPSWFVYVDTVPIARFGHDTLLILVDAETGQATVQECDSWPLLNGASFYGLADVNATSPDAVQVASRAKSLRIALPPMNVQTTGRMAASGTCRAADPDGAKTHYLIVQGDDDKDFSADPPAIQAFLSSAPLPPVGQMTFLKTFEQTEEPSVSIVNAFNSVRNAAKTGDTLVVYVTTHGGIDQSNPSLAPELSYQISCQKGPRLQSPRSDGSKYDAAFVDIRALDFSSCKACRIVLPVDTCFSGNWIPILRPQLDALEKPRDILIFTACDQVQTATGLYDPVQASSGSESTIVPVGGAFTQSLIIAASRQKNIVVKDAVSTDLLASSFDAAYSLTASVNQSFKEPSQNPQRYVRALAPDEVCGKGNQNVAIQ